MTAPAAELRERLVAWFQAHARDLPWRRSPTPYRVLLSELLLQQTRVETALPYFERFVARWPELEDLASATEEEVLSAWAGLGYYRRARHLCAAARAGVAQGGLPADREGLEALPGIGPYTAGVIAAIAFGVPGAAVDGNVERVLSRVDAREADPRSPQGRAGLRARAEALCAPGVASEVVQGLMELGATVCTPRAPACGRCPWADLCVARATGAAESLPRLRPRPRPAAVRGVAGLLVREGRVLVGQRPDGLLGGLWEPVGAEHDPEVDPADALREAFSARVGLAVDGAHWRGTVTHVFTHRRLTLQVYEVEAAGAPTALAHYRAVGWLDPAAPALPLSKLARKTLATRPTATP